MPHTKISSAKFLRKRGYSYREISNNIGVSHETIRRWLHPTIAEKNLQQKREKYNARPDVVQRKQERKAKTKFGLHWHLSRILRSRLHSAIKGNFKAGSAVRDLGCSIAFLKQHLEAQFRTGMSWRNHGKWHIDHKKPLANFDLTDRKQLLQACHFTNLQPLWAKENLSKNKRG